MDMESITRSLALCPAPASLPGGKMAAKTFCFSSQGEKMNPADCAFSAGKK
jgi:hypothetical protein